jgi:phage FluMu protein Com
MMSRQIYKLKYTCPYCKDITFFLEDIEPNSTWWVSFKCSSCKKESDYKWLDELPVEIIKSEYKITKGVIE